VLRTAYEPSEALGSDTEPTYKWRQPADADGA
jgi:hypothetical protein